VVIASAPQTAQTWTNMPAASSELFGTVYSRRPADLTHVSEFRLVVAQSAGGATNAFLRAEFSLDGGSNWAALEAGGTAGDLGVGATTGLKVGVWSATEVAARTDVQLRLIGELGNGSTDPGFRYIAIEFR